MRMRARSFSRVTGAEFGGRKCERRAVRDVVGEALVAFIPVPTMEMYSFTE